MKFATGWTFPVTTLALALSISAPVPAAAQEPAQLKRGAEVYAAQKCQVCHSIGGKGGKSSALDGVGSKLSAADIRRWITNPTEMTAKVNSTKKPPMPAKWASLPAADLDALVAYMASLK